MVRGTVGTVGPAIRQARQRAGLSQVELAERLAEVSGGAIRPRQTDVSNWERGVKTPSPQSLYWLAQVLPELAHVTLGELVGTEGTQK